MPNYEDFNAWVQGCEKKFAKTSMLEALNEAYVYKKQDAGGVVDDHVKDMLQAMKALNIKKLTKAQLSALVWLFNANYEFGHSNGTLHIELHKERCDAVAKKYRESARKLKEIAELLREDEPQAAAVA